MLLLHFQLHQGSWLPMDHRQPQALLKPCIIQHDNSICLQVQGTLDKASTLKKKNPTSLFGKITVVVLQNWGMSTDSCSQ